MEVETEITAEVKAEATNGASKKRKATTTVKSTKRARTAAVKQEVADDESASPEPEEKKAPVKRAARGRAAKAKVTEEAVAEEVKVEEGESGEKEVKVKKTRTRKKKEEDLTPLEPRTVGSKLIVGAHVSTAGGVHNAIPNLIHIGSNAFALFLKSQRKWANPPLAPEHATLFIDGCRKHNIEPGTCCLPHGSYLVNLAHPDPARKIQAYNSFHDDLTRCHKLGIRLYNFHPGNSNACTREEGIALIAEAINEAHKDPRTGDVIPVLETMASRGNTIGGTFEDIAEIIDLVENKDRIGVCIDTCHVFAAGYDLRTPETFAEVMQSFDEVVGLKYLKALHVNDSKAPFRSHRDLHARIGTGYLGLRAFHNLVNDERLHGLPMILETPIDVVGEDGKKVEDKSVWAREIKMLERLVGMDTESEEFKSLEEKLQEEGKGERERVGEQVERKKKKDAGEKMPKAKATTKKAPAKGKGKAKAKKKVESESEEEDMDDDEE